MAEVDDNVDMLGRSVDDSRIGRPFDLVKRAVTRVAELWGHASGVTHVVKVGGVDVGKEVGYRDRCNPFTRNI